MDMITISKLTAKTALPVTVTYSGAGFVVSESNRWSRYMVERGASQLHTDSLAEIREWIRDTVEIEKERAAATPEQLEIMDKLDELYIRRAETCGHGRRVRISAAIESLENRLAELRAEPVAAEPVAAEPVAAEPVAAEPVAAEPVAENKTIRIVCAIEKRAAELGYSIAAVSVSLARGAAAVTGRKENRYQRGADFSVWSAHWDDGAENVQFYWGYYDLTETAAAEIHAQKFSRR